ncbi:hypothetical protein EVAR_25157_1 [Eumeta japonica]|uniref:Uncharacterized protein n=1 Tax=Eumeta variegata TaxID=151549 RepID=A0A4C1VSZ0_EUMVA|nr:hypothetical protein EVAR_25157_1 [Eumeta japonica]
MINYRAIGRRSAAARQGHGGDKSRRLTGACAADQFERLPRPALVNDTDDERARCTHDNGCGRCTGTLLQGILNCPLSQMPLDILFVIVICDIVFKQTSSKIYNFFEVKLLMARVEPKTTRKCVTLNNIRGDVRNNRRIIGGE